MCGIVGFYSFEENPYGQDLDLMLAVFHQSKIRGLHAFGAAIPQPSGSRSFKTFELNDMVPWVRETRPRILLGHTRYSTSGDYKDHANNQPVQWEKQTLVFNGVISMKTREEMEAEYGIKMKSDNDGEIFLQSEQKLEFVTKMAGSFAGIFHDPVFNNLKVEDDVYVLRNPRRPAWTARTETAIFVASTRDILMRANPHWEEEPREVEPNKLWRLKELWN